MTDQDPTNKRAEGGRESEMTDAQLSKRLDDLQKLPDLLAQLVEAKRLMGEDGPDKATAEARNYKFNELYPRYNNIAGRDPDFDEVEKEGGVEREMSAALSSFFEEGSETVPAILMEMGSDGSFETSRDALKVFPDGRILHRRVETEYDSELRNYRFVESKEADRLLQESIKNDEAKIAKSMARKAEVEALRKKLESGKSKK